MAFCMAVLLWLSTPAQASVMEFDFFGLSNNDPVNVAIVESQIKLTVTQTTAQATAGEITFTITNVGPDESTVKSVIFDDADSPFLTGSATIVGTPSVVSFSEDASPANLPAGDMADPDFVGTYSVTADSPPSENGVDPGETLSLTFDLMTSGTTFSDVTSAITTGSLRLGLHVISIGSNENSESVITIPEPGTLLLLGAGVATCLLPSMRLRRSSRG